MKGVMVVTRGTKSGTLYTIVGCINMVVVAEGAFGSWISIVRLVRGDLLGRDVKEP